MDQDAAQRIAQLEAENAELRAQVKQLQALVEKLQARLDQNSSNSSLPPSSDRPWARPVRPANQNKGKRKRGGQKGHKKHHRELVPVEQCDVVHQLFPARCDCCGDKLSDRPHGEPRRHQVFELPEVTPHVEEYRCHGVACMRCGTITEATLPAGVPTGAFGPRLTATVGLLTGWFRLSKRNARQALDIMFGMQMSLGAISNCERQLTGALEAPFAEAHAHVAAQPVRHADETSWRQSGKKAWLWVASTALVSVFMIQAERAGHCARALLDRTHGVLVADRFKAYLFWPMQRRQVCWAHLIRDFRAWSERQEGSIFQSIGGDLLNHAQQMFEWWHRVRDGTMSRASFRKRMRPLQKDVERLLEAGERSCDAALAGKCADILKHRKALWTFVRIEGVEPTNNQAERDLRHAVILRKTSFGTDSVRGSRFIERMLTVVGSLRKQKRDPMSFLVACCEQRLLGSDQQTPSLLPR